MAKINSNQITFVDITDSRKLDIYISSNLPTTQIYNSNTGTYSPDWSITNLQLTSDVYLDSKKITPDTIQWYTKVGITETLVSSNSTLTISTNVLSNNPIVTYVCRVGYQNIHAFKEITFMRTDTGLNGSNGKDGTSVTILGSYNTLAELQVAHPTGNAGDAYIVDGDLYVWAVDDAQWENVGNIQGPAGTDGQNAKNIILTGDSQVFKVSKSNVITPSTIKVTAYAFNTTATTWTYSTNGGQTFLSTVPTGVSRNGNIVTITGSAITANSIVIKASDGEVEDVFTIYKAIDGADGGKGNDGAPAPIAFLTNENVTFSANAQGQIPLTTITSNIVAYSGTTKVTPTIGTITGAPTGMTITPSTITASNEVMLTITIANNSTLDDVMSNMGVISVPVTYPVSTVLYLTWSKVNAGATGPTGAAGSDAYTVILTNESNTFAGDVSNAMAGSTTTQVLAYRGATAQTVTISSVNGKAAATTDTDTGIAGLKFRCSALSGASPTITFTCTTAFVSASGSIPIVLSVGGILFTKMFTYSIAFKGATGATGIGQTGPAGTPATSYWLVSSASAVQKTSTGTITVTPSTLTFAGKSQTGTATPTNYACRWVIDYSTDGTTYTNLVTSTTNEASKTITVLTTYKTIRARMYLAGGTATLLDEQIIPVVVDGTSASIVDITPSSYYFKSTTGKDGTFTPDYIYLYPRFQTVTFSKWEYSVNGGTTWVAASGANGLTIGTYSSITNTLRISRTSTLYTDTVTSISFRCVSSNAAVYDTISIAKLFDVDVEEINTRITDGFAEVKTTTDSIISNANNTEKTVATINGNLSSLTTRVSTAEQKITPTAIVSTVRQSTDYTNDLNEKVGNTEIISKINQTAEAVTISANKIGLLGATNIPDLTADKIKGGTLILGGSSAATQNGQVLVKNASNTDVVKLNKDGVIVKSGHLAVARDFTNQTYNWDTDTWTTSTNTSQLDLGDNFIRMGAYGSGGYSNSMTLLDDGLYFQGSAHAIGNWDSFVGHDDLGDFVIQDTVRGNIFFRGQGEAELANISGDGLRVNGPISGGLTSGNAKQFTNVFCKHFPGGQTGYITIKLGTATLDLTSMITVKGHVTSYQNSTSFEASCYFYAANGMFHGTVATMSNPDVLREVYFAIGSSDNCVYLILGAANATWDYPTIAINNLSVGFYGHDSTAWNNGWAATIHTNLSSFKTITACARSGMKKTLWSGAVQIGATVTLNENLRNFKFLTCLMGDASTSWGIPLGTFLDDEVTELHFGAIYTGNDSIAGGNLYGARFNINSQTSLSLQSMGTKQGAGAYLRKIVGWR